MYARCAGSVTWCAMRQASASSLLRRLMVGFTLVIVGMALAGLVNAVYEAKSNQQIRTASENRARARELALSMVLVANDSRSITALASASEALRREMFRELDYHSRVRLRIWKAGTLVYNSAPELPDVLPAPEVTRVGANGWVRWSESDQASGIRVERMHEVDDEWMLTASGLRYLLSPTIAALPFLLIIAFGVIRIGLGPLRAIAAAIEGRAGSDLSALTASPYRELSPLIDAINRLMARLHKRIEHEHEFLSDAAHELKTPLAAIGLNAHLLCARLGKLGDRDDSDGPGKALRDSVARASHVVHQLLALERMQADMPTEPTALDALVRDRLAYAATLALARGIDIEFDVASVCVLPLHRESMAGLLDNLIGNAVKYSPDGATVSVTLACGNGVAGGAVLKIRDHGPGIPTALRSKVFERFFRIAGNDQPGSGLGLAIAERAAARNGAGISLESPAMGPGLEVRVSWGSARAGFARSGERRQQS